MKIADFLLGIYRGSTTPMAVKAAGAAPLLFASLATIYLIYAVSALWRSGTTAAPSDTMEQTGVTADSSASVAPPTDYLQIGDWHLFGQAAEAMDANAAVTQTQLQLKLLGVFALSQMPDATSVIIQAEDGSQKKYKAGDELPGGATLQGIDGTQVLLLHNGRRELLALQRHDAALAGNAE